MSEDWRSLFVNFDEDGLLTLTNAASHAVASLARSKGPRSNVTPAALHEMVWALEVCPEEGRELDQVLDELGNVVWSNGVAPSDPACVAHLHPPSLVPSVVTDLVISAANQSMDSWDQAPTGTEVELHLMEWLCEQLAFPTSGSGIMTSGGTASNLLAMTIARSSLASSEGVDVLKSGLPDTASSWRILCSDQAHFSVQRAAAQLGLGRDAVICVASEQSGAMNVSDLDAQLERLRSQGLTVMALVATAGTTDLGVIDPLDEIAQRARRVGAWFHVDAAVCGAFVLSHQLRPRLTGIEFADSVTIDFHKLWWQPFNASALVVRDAAQFDLLRVKSNYLDRGDEIEGMTNLVGRSLDTSRRFDAAKVVATLRTLGRRTMASMIDYLVELTLYAASSISAQPRLKLMSPPTSVMCVFQIDGCDAHDLREIQQHLLARGEMVLGRTEIRGEAALKFTFMNPLTTREDVDQLIDTVVREASTKTREGV